MYVQHPYKFNDKYYANIDGQFIEISKEVAKVMLADYRNEINRSRRWAPDEKNPTKPTELLDCVFSANAEGFSMEDLEDETQFSPEELILRREMSDALHQKMDRLDPQELFIIKSIYFEGMKQVEIAEILGVTKGRLSQKVSAILRKMKRMYDEEEN